MRASPFAPPPPPGDGTISLSILFLLCFFFWQGSRLQHQKKLKFIHITKTGGTSIENIGIQYGKLWGKLHIEYGFWHEPFPFKSKKLRDKYECTSHCPYLLTQFVQHACVMRKGACMHSFCSQGGLHIYI